MKFKVKRETLSSALDIIQNIVSAKATLPILSNILLETHKDKLRLTATDLNIGISCVIPVDIQEQGAITLPARRFGGIVRELQGDDIEIITRKNNVVAIENKNCQFKIIGLPPEEFPRLPEFKDKEVIKLEQKSLKTLLNKTSFAVSQDETRYILNGILFSIVKDQLTLVATDGKRLAIHKSKIAAVGKELSFIVPLRTVQELLRNLKDEGDVSITVGSNQVLFDFKDSIIISRLIEGEFPDYQQVIPPASETKIKIHREQFLLAVRRASLLATPDYQAVKLEVFRDRMVISKSTPDVGESREEVPIQYAGKEMIIGFNPSYLTDVLKNLAGQQVEFELTGSEKPGVVRDDGYVYIVLPMRLG